MTFWDALTLYACISLVASLAYIAFGLLHSRGKQLERKHDAAPHRQGSFAPNCLTTIHSERNRSLRSRNHA